jgi:hypothetical protein
MSYHTFIEGLRLADAIMAAVVFALLVNRGRRFWTSYDASQKWMMSAFTLYTLAVSYTSFELWVQDVNVGLRSYVVLVANLFTLYALWRYRESIVLGGHDDHHPTLR